MSSCANKVPNEINKWIIKRIRKTAILEYGKKRRELVLNNLIRSQFVQNMNALT